MLNYISTSVEATKMLGYKLASKLKKGDTLVLNGDLGSGKTIFVSGFLSFYDKESEIASPTFTILNEHNLTKDLNLYHFDVYRLESCDEFLAIGGDEYFSQGVTLIEWGEKIEPLAYHEINKQFRCSILNQDLTKKQIREKLDQLYWSVKNPVFYQEWMGQTGLD